MADYQLITDSTTVLRREDEAYIPDDPANKDRADFDAWVADGGVPDPAPVPPAPPDPEPVELSADPVADMDAATKGYVDAEVSSVTARVDALERRAAAADGGA